MLLLHWKDICNVAGAITLSRLGIAVVFPFFASEASVAAVLLLYGAVSDILDGVVARRTGTVSHTGGFIDGWVDKIFNINVAWSLVIFDYLPWWMALLLFSREWFQIPLVPYYVTRYLRGYIPKNNPFWAGKVASVSLVVSFFAGILALPKLLMYSSILTFALGLWTALVYVEREFQIFSVRLE